jgi:hypothetical protein
MAAKKTRRTKKINEVVEEEIKETKEKKSIPTKKVYVVKFESQMVGKEFIEPGIAYKQLPDRRTEKITILKEPFKMVSGQTKTIDEETYNYLVEKEAIITLEQKEERDLYRAKKLKLKSGRAEPKKEMQTLSDEEKLKLFVELPYLAEIKEVELEEEE